MLRWFSVLILVLTIFISPAKAEINPDTIIQIFERLETLEKKTRELHGENEVLKHQIEQLKKVQKQGFLNVDERIDEIQNSSSKSDSSSEKKDASDEVVVVKSSQEVKETAEKKIAQPAEKKPVEADKPTLQTAVPDKPEQQATEPSPTNPDTAQAAKKASRAPTAYEKETYQAAFNKMSASPTAATQAFKEYIKLQPESPLAANAQYWIGEIMYSHNNYKGAVQEFIKVLQQYKYSNKAPDAAIKLGYSFYALKNWAYARRTFEDVIKYFPENKNAVNLATKRLEKMKTAGN